MVYMEEFTNRLLKILDTRNLSASQFAEKIGVQRSSVSHILSKRNKPSLDFIIKISKTFDDISLDWLINGDNGLNSSEISYKKNSSNPIPNEIENINSTEKELDKIVFFYNDKSYKIFKN
ncbi:MAG: transcriptional regulator [Flavobacteriaceae bacterium]|nr:transcriptional regulator [Flavobacteriaceae bacterium]